MKIALNVVLVVLVVLAALVMVDATRPASYRKRAVRIQVGDSKERVRILLGKPTGGETTMGPLTATSTVFTVTSEVWSYGSYLDWCRLFSREFPWIAPQKLFRFRLGTDPNEVNVYLDSTGRVVRVQIPKS